jgi:hypothetical protein
MNNLISNVQIIEDPIRVILVCRNLSLQINLKILTEKHSVLFHIKLETNQVSFFFGKTNTASEVKELFNQFMLSS